MEKNTKRLFSALFLILFFVSCNTGVRQFKIKDGQKGGNCYENGSCNDGLICENDKCVEILSQNDDDSSTLTDSDIDIANTGDIENDIDSGDSGNTGSDNDADTGNTGDTINDPDVGNTGNTGDDGNTGNTASDTDMDAGNTGGDGKTICTGQAKCYNGTVEMTCPTEESAFYGQDSQYAALSYCTPKSFTVSGTAGADVVTDNNTGLIWQRSLPVTYSACTGGDPVGSTCQWQEAINYCNGLTYAGQTDWRLPTIQELATLLDYGRYNPAIDITIFPSNLDSYSYYWSSSSNSTDTNKAWEVSIGFGSTNNFTKTEKYYARCVIGNSLVQNVFNEKTVAGKVVITDSVTELIWTKERSATTLNWQNALNYCETLNYAGYTDWRLPNINELKTLIDNTRENPASSFPEMSSSYFWSSSSYLYGTSYAWYVMFNNGRVNPVSNAKTTSDTLYAICVK